MANRERGEIGLRAGSKIYILKPSTNAMCEMEEVSGKTFKELIDSMVKTGGFQDIRLFLWGMLRAHHPEVTLEQAGDIIDEAGGILGVTAQIEAVIKANMPVQVKGRAGNPRKARTNGTGAASTSTRVASV